MANSIAEIEEMDIQPSTSMVIPNTLDELIENPTEDLLKIRELYLRYQWLLATADSKSCQSHLEQLALLMHDEDVIKNHNYTAGDLTLEQVLERLLEHVRRTYIEQIDNLKKAEQYDDLKKVLISDFDWDGATPEALLENAWLVFECCLKSEAHDEANDWICRILEKLMYQEISSQELADQTFHKCLAHVQNFQLEKLDEENINLIAHRLSKLADMHRYSKDVDLWICCYKVVKQKERNLTYEALEEFYDENASCHVRMPARSLCLLAKAHDVLGPHRTCGAQDGKFLWFYLKELRQVLEMDVVKEFMEEDPYRKEYTKCIEKEIFQCLHCFIGFTNLKSRQRLEDHGSLKLEAPWELIELVLPILTHQIKTLPLLDDLLKISADAFDGMLRAFEFVVKYGCEGLEPDEFQSVMKRIDEFLEHPPKVDLQKEVNSEGKLVRFLENFEFEQEPESNSLWPVIDENKPKSKSGLEMASKLFYLFAHHHYRIGSKQEMQIYAKATLALGCDVLDKQVYGTTWAILGHAAMELYSELPDEELLGKLDVVSFPFKMALIHDQNLCDIHVNMANILYQIRTRVYRSLRSKNTHDYGLYRHLLARAKTHLETAMKYNEWEHLEVDWLSLYFQAKIAEKEKEPCHEIFELYRRCVVTMDDEGYVYTGKINQTNQKHFEPLEIHYRVHNYAMKMLRRQKNDKDTCLDEKVKELRVIALYLTVFLDSGVAKRTHLPNPDKLKLTIHDEEVIRKNVEEILSGKDAKDTGSDLVDMVHQLLEATSLKNQIEKLTIEAYESIIARFPHYKSFYRIAEYYAIEQNKPAKALDFLFAKIYKKQPPNGTIFDNIIDIKRSDFERVGSLAYHVMRITRLAVECAVKSEDLERLEKLIFNLIIADKHSHVLIDEFMRQGLIHEYMDSYIRIARRKGPRTIPELGAKIDLLRKMMYPLEKSDSFKKEYDKIKSIYDVYIGKRDQLNEIERKKLEAERERKRRAEQAEHARQVAELQARSLAEEASRKNLDALFRQPSTSTSMLGTTVNQQYDKERQVQEALKKIPTSTNASPLPELPLDVRNLLQAYGLPIHSSGITLLVQRLHMTTAFREMSEELRSTMNKQLVNSLLICRAHEQQQEQKQIPKPSLATTSQMPQTSQECSVTSSVASFIASQTTVTSPMKPDQATAATSQTPKTTNDSAASLALKIASTMIQAKKSPSLPQSIIVPRKSSENSPKPTSIHQNQLTTSTTPQSSIQSTPAAPVSTSATKLSSSNDDIEVLNVKIAKKKPKTDQILTPKSAPQASESSTTPKFSQMSQNTTLSKPTHTSNQANTSEMIKMLQQNLLQKSKTPESVTSVPKYSPINALQAPKAAADKTPSTIEEALKQHGLTRPVPSRVGTAPTKRGHVIGQKKTTQQSLYTNFRAQQLASYVQKQQAAATSTLQNLASQVTKAQSSTSVGSPMHNQAAKTPYSQPSKSQTPKLHVSTSQKPSDDLEIQILTHALANQTKNSTTSTDTSQSQPQKSSNSSSSLQQLQGLIQSTSSSQKSSAVATAQSIELLKALMLAQKQGKSVQGLISQAQVQTPTHVDQTLYNRAQQPTASSMTPQSSTQKASVSPPVAQSQAQKTPVSSIFPQSAVQKQATPTASSVAHTQKVQTSTSSTSGSAQKTQTTINNAQNLAKTFTAQSMSSSSFNVQNLVEQTPKATVLSSISSSPAPPRPTSTAQDPKPNISTSSHQAQAQKPSSLMPTVYGQAPTMPTSAPSVLSRPQIPMPASQKPSIKPHIWSPIAQHAQASSSTAQRTPTMSAPIPTMPQVPSSQPGQQASSSSSLIGMPEGFILMKQKYDQELQKLIPDWNSRQGIVDALVQLQFLKGRIPDQEWHGQSEKINVEVRRLAASNLQQALKRSQDQGGSGDLKRPRMN